MIGKVQTRNDLAAGIIQVHTSRPGPNFRRNEMAVKKYFPTIDQAIRIAVTIAIVFFVLNNVAPESIKKFFRV